MACAEGPQLAKASIDLSEGETGQVMRHERSFEPLLPHNLYKKILKIRPGPLDPTVAKQGRSGVQPSTLELSALGSTGPAWPLSGLPNPGKPRREMLPAAPPPLSPRSEVQRLRAVVAVKDACLLNFSKTLRAADERAGTRCDSQLLHLLTLNPARPS